MRICFECVDSTEERDLEYGGALKVVDWQRTGEREKNYNLLVRERERKRVKNEE